MTRQSNVRFEVMIGLALIFEKIAPKRGTNQAVIDAINVKLILVENECFLVSQFPDYVPLLHNKELKHKRSSVHPFNIPALVAKNNNTVLCLLR